MALSKQQITMLKKRESRLARVNELYQSLLSKSKISKKIFLEKYGHLRPGTYDITIPRYDSNSHFFEHFTTDFRVNAPPAFSKNTLLPCIGHASI